MSNKAKKGYIGIDVSKLKLDVCFDDSGHSETFTNDNQGFKLLISKIKKYKNPHVIMEATGGYEQQVHQFLTTSGIAVSIVNAGRVRHFAKSKSILEKTDKIDAHVIRWFGKDNDPAVTELRDPLMQRFSDLSKRRDQLIEHRKLELQYEEKSENKEISICIRKTIKYLEKQIANTEVALEKILEENSLRKKAEIINSFKGCGKNAVFTLLSDLPELGEIDHKPLSKLVGLAPLAHDSGKFKGKRITTGGRSRARRALYLCALSAVQYNPQIKAMHQRLISKGKSPKAVLIACAHKILHILNAMMRKAEKWNPEVVCTVA